MVCEWGMSDRLGPLTYGEKQEEIFLGREIGMHRDYSETTAREIDEEIKRIVGESENRAEAIVKKNLVKLKRLAQKLLDKEILNGEEIDEILKDDRQKKDRKSSRRNP
jgi:cell division protease FtsH